MEITKAYWMGKKIFWLAWRICFRR